MKSIAGGRYRIGSVLASGSFGKVYSDPPFAVKEIKLPSRSGGRIASSLSSIISNEISILTQLNHEHVVKLF
jgi:serine/threonine protein kinase